MAYKLFLPSYHPIVITFQEGIIFQITSFNSKINIKI